MANPLITYLKESREELRKVSWPSRQTVVRDTLIVLSISIAVALFFSAIDFGLSYGFEKFLAL